MHAHTMAQDGLKPVNRARPWRGGGAGSACKIFEFMISNCISQGFPPRAPKNSKWQDLDPRSARN